MSISMEADAMTLYPLPVQVDTYVIRRPKLTFYVPHIRGCDGEEPVSGMNRPRTRDGLLPS
ncbi:hypothetical protein [Paenibacillus popilliae]|uniref:hypothetical protein n=1 Tax=Paenibacillus popilliae TaxID=78057 RepID=UPI000B87ED56|nr:hypothetical protein [Paenibacillus popilliae]